MCTTYKFTTWCHLHFTVSCLKLTQDTIYLSKANQDEGASKHRTPKYRHRICRQDNAHPDEIKESECVCVGNSLTFVVCTLFPFPFPGVSSRPDDERKQTDIPVFLSLLPHWLICVRAPPWKRLVKAGRNLFRPPRIKLWIFKRPHSPLCPRRPVKMPLFRFYLTRFFLDRSLRLLHFDFLKHFPVGWPLRLPNCT